MKTTILALTAAVLAVTAGCDKNDNDEAARQAETFRANDSTVAHSPSASTAPHGSPSSTTTTGDIAAMGSGSNANGGANTNRVGLDVGVDKNGNTYKVNADGYRVDDRGQRVDSNTDTLGQDIKAGAQNAGVAVKSDGVGDLDLGRTLNATGDVADRTQQFKVGDPIVASIDADNLASGGALTATLKTKAGKVITTAKSTMSAGKENASFNLGTAPAAGDYVLTVSGAGGEIESQTFSVRN